MSEEENKEEHKIPPYEISFSFDANTGLRSAILKVNSGFPQNYLGTYRLTEWTYGEKIHVEIQVERIRAEKIGLLNSELASLKDNTEQARVRSEINRLENRIDSESFIMLQTLTCIKESPITLDGMEAMRRLPGRVGTILANITGFLCIAPDAEKKG